MGLAGSLGWVRRRIIGGLVVAFALIFGSAVIVVANQSDATRVINADRVASRQVGPAPRAALPAAAVPAADAAVAAAVWSAEHPPPPPPLPVPASMPDPSGQRTLAEIGRIQIPKTGVDQAVREGIEQMVIDAGPAHWPGTAEFGGWGNVVLAGHRSTKTAPFLRNGELAAGDEIVLTDLTGSYHYSVTSVEVVPATAMWIVDQREGRTMTIFTCHPIGSSAERLVVRAELTSRSRPGA